MPEAWIVFALLASLMWGTYAIIAKVVTSETYYGLNAASASFLMLIGIAVLFLGFSFGGFAGSVSIPKNSVTLVLGILTGILWAAGMVFAFLAFRGGADAAKLVPLYNTNTLIAVILGIALLHELPQATNMLKVIAGALMIVIGAVLVSS